MERELRGLPWVGAKSATGKNGTCQWIVDMLPHTSSYVEPFFGMGGIFLRKRQCGTEWVNDIDGRLMNWWRVVAEKPEQFGLRLETIGQRTEETHEWACNNLDSENPVDAATAFTVLIQNSRLRVASAKTKFHPDIFQRTYPLLSSRVLALHKRLYKAYITQRDACDIIEKVYATGIPKTYSVCLYLDPPYQVGTSRSAYVSMPDYDRMSDLLSQDKEGKFYVAISGYNDEWGHLGWCKHEKEVKTHIARAMGPDKTSKKRVECLWTNYDPGELWNAN